MINGYNFYFMVDNDLLTFPITPGELTIKSGSNNKVINLINEGDINILKSPSLTEINFEARFPMRQYPYAREFRSFQSYFEVFKEIKTEKKPFRFVVSRFTPNGISTWGTEYLVSLEDLELLESANEGDDVIVSFKLKQYEEYGVVKLSGAGGGHTTSKYTSNVVKTTTTRQHKLTNTNRTYKVVSGDCLWNIAKKFYGDGELWDVIYKANYSAIEADARAHNKQSSSNGHWIYPGLMLIIPAR